MSRDRDDLETLSRLGQTFNTRISRTISTAYSEEREAYRFVRQPFFTAGRDEYSSARELKRALMAQYREAVLEEVIGGGELITELGICYHLKTVGRANFNTIPLKRSQEHLLSDFKVLDGIRDKTERALKEKGYNSVADLVGHDRFGDRALRFLELIEMRDTYQLIEWIGKRYSKSHPLTLYASGLHAKEQLLFVDIETLGLYASPVILIGVARAAGETVTIHQYILRGVHEEPAALAALLSHVDGESAFITFNGRAFDMPFLEQRLAYYRMCGDLRRAHFDMLYHSRRAWNGVTTDSKLTTLERHLVGTRKADVPSALIPEFYESYVRTQNIGPLIAIIDHNRQDLLALVHVFSRLCEDCLCP